MVENFQGAYMSVKQQEGIDTEFIIGLCGGTGVNLNRVAKRLKEEIAKSKCLLSNIVILKVTDFFNKPIMDKIVDLKDKKEKDAVKLRKVIHEVIDMQANNPFFNIYREMQLGSLGRKLMAENDTGFESDFWAKIIIGYIRQNRNKKKE